MAFSCKSFKIGWVRGFFDGEGSSVFSKKGDATKKTHYKVSVCNTDPNLIKICSRYLNELGINHTISLYPTSKYSRMPHWKDQQVIGICRAEDIIKFNKIIGFHAKHKQKKLEEIIAWVKRPKCKYSKEYLANLYINQNMSISDICRFIYGTRSGVSFIRNIMMKYRIPLRDKSSVIKESLRKKYNPS